MQTKYIQGPCGSPGTRGIINSSIKVPLTPTKASVVALMK